MKPYVKTGLAWTGVAVFAMSVISTGTWAALPQGVEIPVHWGISGEADRYGTRDEAALLLVVIPFVTLITGLILAAAPSIDPRKGNIETGRRAYLATWISTMVLLTLVHGGICRMMAGGPDANSSQLVRWVIAGCAILLIVIGNYLPKTRSSFIFGIRTPWTLSSNIAWEKTHRFGGRLLMIAGALGLAGAFLFDGLFLALQLSVLALGSALITIIYSYFAWKSAGDRDAGTGLTV